MTSVANPERRVRSWIADSIRRRQRLDAQILTLLAIIGMMTLVWDAG